MRFTAFQETLIYRYGLAVLIALGTVLLSALLWDDVLEDGPFILLIAAVVFAAWQGGLLPGILCAALSILLLDFFLIGEPYMIFTEPADILRFTIFALCAGLISWLEEARTRSAQSLRALKDELEVILNAVSEGIMVQDAEGRIVFANAASESITGQPQRSMFGAPIHRIPSRYTAISDDEEATLGVGAMPRYQVFATGQPAELVFGLRGGPDVRWINLKTSPVFDDQGGVRLVVNVFHDITEKRTAEKQRAENAARLRKVLDNLAAYVAVLTPDGVLVEVNRSALQIVNLKPEEMLGKRLDQTYGWDQDAETQAAVRAAITRAAAGETVRYDVSFRLPDGRPIIVDFILAPLFGADGKVEYLIPSGVDITARSELTARLAQQQRRMELILNSIPGIVFEGRGSPDKGDQKMEFISNYVEPMLGYSPEDWMNDPHFWRTIVLPEDAQTVLQQATEIYEGGAPGRLQFRCTASDGRVVHVEAYSRILKDEAGQPAGVVGVMLDVTERRQIEELIVRYAEELRQSNQELEQFAYVASHDLQEPLRMVTSYLQLVEQRYGDRLDGDAKEFIGFAIDGASRMKILINDLLTYSRVQRSQAQFEPVALEMALETALGNLQLAVEDSGALITHDPLPQIIAHPTQMTQLLQNLLSNAIKFRGERTPQIHIGAKRERGNWHITVKDNGIGIEPEYLERIFVIFQRLHARTEYPGTGIGLAICKKIVEKHGGQIYAESTPGEGATFHLMFPMDRTNRSKRREIDTHSAGRR